MPDLYESCKSIESNWERGVEHADLRRLEDLKTRIGGVEQTEPRNLHAIHDHLVSG